MGGEMNSELERQQAKEAGLAGEAGGGGGRSRAGEPAGTRLPSKP